MKKKMGRFKAILILFLVACFSLHSAAELRKGDVRETMDELLALHVEHHKIEPDVYARAMKIFIEQFDGAKVYFLDSEVKSFLNLSQKQVQKGIREYQKSNYIQFVQGTLLIQKAIRRAQSFRQEIEKELSLSALDITPARGETYLSYSRDEASLKTRLHKILVRILLEEKKANQLESWTPKDREKIFALWEGRYQRKEAPYLKAGRENEHYLALHSLRALAKSLDAHTAYYSPEEARELRTALQKQFEGVGVVLREGIHGVVIEGLVKDGPAERSGQIIPGDRIVEIDGHPIADKSYEEVLSLMQGKGKKELRLGLVRDSSSKIHTVYLIREKIVMTNERLQYTSHPVEGGHVGVLTLPSFYEGGHGSSADAEMRDPETE